MAFYEKLRSAGVFDPKQEDNTPVARVGRQSSLKKTLNTITPFIDEIKNRDLYDNKANLLMEQQYGGGGRGSAPREQAFGMGNTDRMNTVFIPPAPRESGIMNPKEREAFKLQQKALDTSVDSSKADTALAAARLQLDTFKAQNPGMELMVNADGNVVGINPVTGATFDTGIASNTLSDRDKLDLQFKNEAELARIRGDIESGQIAQRGQIESEQIGERGREDRLTRQTPDAGSTPAGQVPSQQRTALINRANQALNEHPEWSRWINTDPNGYPMIEEAGTRRFGPDLDEDTRRQIYDYIYNGVTAPNTSVAGPTISPEEQAARSALAEIGITNPNATQIQEAIKDLAGGQ